MLHAANQDLPCLAEVGIRPRRLFDTELAGRLAGLPRVGLGPLVEQMLGLHLRKGHGAADWSTRPLPHDWLVYAALDVEVLVELRDAMEAELVRQGKLEWAHQEFAAIVDRPARPPRIDPWRRTSGMHRITDRRALAVIRELWTTRDAVGPPAGRRPAPDPAGLRDHRGRGRASPTDGRGAHRAAGVLRSDAAAERGLWLSADRQGAGAACRGTARRPAAGRRPAATGQVGVPGPGGRCPAAGRARSALAELSERVGTPVENLVSPDVVRRILWSPPDDPARHLLAAAGRPRQPSVADRTDRTAAHGSPGCGRRQHAGGPSYPPVTSGVGWRGGPSTCRGCVRPERTPGHGRRHPFAVPSSHRSCPADEREQSVSFSGINFIGNDCSGTGFSGTDLRAGR